MARSITQICNEAISDLPAHPITDISDTAKEARECSRHLSGAVSDLLGYHDFQFARRRVALASVTNDRDGEWTSAYAMPDEIVSPIKLLLAGSRAAFDYEIANGVLYTNLAEAVLEYSVEALEPNKWSPLFAQAVIRTLAARIYRPILGEKADTNEWLAKQAAAQRAVNEAVADDLNRHPRRRKSFTSEAAIARQSHDWGCAYICSGGSAGLDAGDFDPGDLAGIVGG